MTQTVTIDTPRPLTEFERRQVQSYAEFLIAKREPLMPAGSASTQPRAPHRITFEGWAGSLAGVEPEKSNKQFVQDAWDDVLSKSET